MTAEVFGALDFLPRDDFLGEVLRQASGGSEAAKSAVADAVEEATVTVLSGDLQPRYLDESPTPWRVQPDVTIESDDICCLVEAKRIRAASFQRDQLLRTLMALRTCAHDRTPLLLLVTGQPPPLPVSGLGRLQPLEAVDEGLADLPVAERPSLQQLAAEGLVWTTWSDITTITRNAADGWAPAEPSGHGSVQRLAGVITASVARHS